MRTDEKSTEPMTQKSIYDRAHRLANEIAEIVADADRWNRAHPDDEPIEPDPDGQLRATYDSLGILLRQVDDVRVAARNVRLRALGWPV